MTEYQGYLQSLLSRLQDLGINLPVSLDNMTLESIERCTDVIDQFLSLNKLLLIADSDLGLRVNETSGGVNLNDVLLDKILKEINETSDLSGSQQTVLVPDNSMLESQHTNQPVKNNSISDLGNVNFVSHNDEIDVDLDEEENEYDEYSQEDSSNDFDEYDNNEYGSSEEDSDEDSSIDSESEYDTEVEEDLSDDEYDTEVEEDSDEYDTPVEGLEDEVESDDYECSEDDTYEYDTDVTDEDEYSDDESEGYDYEPSIDDLSEEDDLGLDDYNTPSDTTEDELNDEYSDDYEQQVEDDTNEFEDDYSNYNKMYDQYEDPDSSLYDASPLHGTNIGNNINNSLSGYNNAQQKGTNGDLDDILANKLKNVVDSVINKVKKPK